MSAQSVQNNIDSISDQLEGAANKLRCLKLDGANLGIEKIVRLGKIAEEVEKLAKEVSDISEGIEVK